MTVMLALAAPTAAIIGALIAAHASRVNSRKSLSDQLETLASLLSRIDGLPDSSSERSTLEAAAETLRSEIEQQKEASKNRSAALEALSAAMLFGALVGVLESKYSSLTISDPLFWGNIVAVAVFAFLIRFALSP